MTQSNSLWLGKVCIATKYCVQFSTLCCVQSLECKKLSQDEWICQNLSDEINQAELCYILQSAKLCSLFKTMLQISTKWDTFKRLAISLSLWLHIPISQVDLMSADGLPSPKDLCRILLSFNTTVLLPC